MDPFASSPLPDPVYRLVPEIREFPVANTLANCSRCVMVAAHTGESPDKPWAFNADTRCCTYNPVYPNFLAGRSLRRGGRSAERIRARLRSPKGVSAWGIRPPKAWSELYNKTKTTDFGRALDLRCPYWVGGEHACGIWADRPSVCRTWFCKYDRGRTDADAWHALEDAMTEAFDDLARHCVKHGGGGPGPGATPKAWARWFQWCADRVDALTPEECAGIGSLGLAGARAILREATAAEAPPVPDVATASVSWREDEADTTRLVGYSTFDGVRVPRSVYVFLAKLDGTRPWREALAEAQAEGATVTEAQVRDLFRVGALRHPEAGDVRDPNRRDDLPEIAIRHQSGVFADLTAEDVEIGDMFDDG